MLKFQAVAEKTAKNFGGYFFLPHPVQTLTAWFFEATGGLLSTYCSASA